MQGEQAKLGEDNAWGSRQMASLLARKNRVWGIDFRVEAEIAHIPVDLEGGGKTHRRRSLNQ